MMTVLKSLPAQASAGVMLFFIKANYAMASFGAVPDTGGNVGGDGNIRGAIITVLQAILNLMGAIAVAVIIIAGVRLVIGGQDEAQREKARNAILYAVIGLVVILLAKAIVDFVDTEIGTGGG